MISFSDGIWGLRFSFVTVLDLVLNSLVNPVTMQDTSFYYLLSLISVATRYIRNIHKEYKVSNMNLLTAHLNNKRKTDVYSVFKNKKNN